MIGDCKPIECFWITGVGVGWKPPNACMEKKAEEHGGILQYEIYLWECPDPDAEDPPPPDRIISHPAIDEETPCSEGAIFDREEIWGCEAAEVCALMLDPKVPFACIIVRAEDGTEITRCYACTAAADQPMGCSGTSSSSSSSSDDPPPPVDSSSSSSSGSGSITYDLPSSSSSGSGGSSSGSSSSSDSSSDEPPPPPYDSSSSSGSGSSDDPGASSGSGSGSSSSDDPCAANPPTVSVGDCVEPGTVTVTITLPAVDPEECPDGQWTVCAGLDETCDEDIEVVPISGDEQVIQLEVPCTPGGSQPPIFAGAALYCGANLTCNYDAMLYPGEST